MKVIIPSKDLIGQPDVIAMLQAFYSRSHKSIEDRLNELTEDNQSVKDGLAKWFINYGHSSIGDCGVLPVFVEGVTMLTAKALQDNPLYNGQESSSRYIDFSKQEPSPFLNEQQLGYHNHMINVYVKKHAEFKERFLAEGLTDKQASLKAFDKARGYLPMTATTQLSLAMNFRQLRYQLWSIVKNHPVGVVRQEVQVILDMLIERYRDLFVKCPSNLKSDFGWYDHRKDLTWNFLRDTAINLFESPQRLRPRKAWAEIPEDHTWRTYTTDNELNQSFLGDEIFVFDLDYGSFRDLQRHRSATIYHWGVISSIDHPFYEDDSDMANHVPAGNTIDPTLCNLGNIVKVAMKISLLNFIYLIKLRSQPTVHPTLRLVIKRMAEYVDVIYPHLNIMQYVDMSDMDYEKREQQDITAK